MHNIYVHFSDDSIYESEIIMGILKNAGFSLVAQANDAEIIIANIGPVKDKEDFHQIEQYSKDKKLLVIGCLTRARIYSIRKISEDISILDVCNKFWLVEAIEEIIDGNVVELVSEQPGKKRFFQKIFKNPMIGIVPIISGCSERCRECYRLLRKNVLDSYPQDDVLSEVQYNLKAGCKEIQIVAQDISFYGTEKIWRSSLPELIAKIIALENNFKIKLGRINPKNLKPILEEMLSIYKNDKVFKLLYLPIFSGSNEILDKMRLGFSIEECKDFIRLFRDKIPNVSIYTDVIVGFPAETDAHFSKTLEAIRDIKPNVVNTIRFATANEKAKERETIISDLVASIARINNEKWFGWTGEILIEEKRSGVCMGRNFAFKSVSVIGNYNTGEKLKVKIVNITPADLKGEVIESKI